MLHHPSVRSIQIEMLTRTMWQHRSCRVLLRSLSSSSPPVGTLHGVRYDDHNDHDNQMLHCIVSAE